MITLADVQAAAARIDGAVLRTPLVRSPALSERLEAEVWLKLENRQRTAAFKERGALNRLLCLSPEERQRGVIAMSAGNHAQGVALHAQRLGIPATIVMPRHTAFRKVHQTQRYGAEVVLEGDDVLEAGAHAAALAAARGLTLIHPYDDALVIAGQGTIALEILEARPDLEAVVIPVGGGGLAAGVTVAMRALRPGISLLGVQAAAYQVFYDRFHGLEEMPATPTIAEGIAVKTPGARTAPILERGLDDVLLATEEQLEAAIMLFLEEERLVVEGAGAAPLAALLARPGLLRGRRIALIVSGGNLDSALLATVIQRSMVRDGRVSGLRIQLPDVPGALARVAGVIGECGGNIVETHHQRTMSDISAKAAEIDLVVETRDAVHAAEIRAALGAAGYRFRMLNRPPTADA